jgi:hypothetical protein
MRRCPAPLTMLAAALALGLGSRPEFTQADTINSDATTATASYTLTSSAGLPVPGTNISGPQVEALILPPGGVMPPTSGSGTQESPLTILSGSHGFDPSQLVVALKNATSSSGQPEQMFGLVFFGQGLAPGGVLNFSLSIEKSLANDPPQLQVLTPGVTITPESGTSSPPPSSPPANGGSPPSAGEVPEPLSLVLWSALAGAALVRARSLGRSRRASRGGPRGRG